MSEKRIIISEVQAISLAQHIQNEADIVDLIPTDAQKAAGNYKMGHIRVKGMKISIENPKGSYRIYTNDDGSKGYNKMSHHYGYFGSSKGKDGDAVDVFIGDNIEDFDKVYVIDQNRKDSDEFDESKVMLGFTSKQDAYEAYMSNYEEGWTGFRAITSVPLVVFKKWLYRGRKQRQPFANYVAIKKKQLAENRIMISEANQNLPYKDFLSDIAKLGLTYREGAGSARVFYLPEFEDATSVSIHNHGSIGNVDPKSLVKIKNKLEAVGWFDNPDNFRKFPFSKWGVQRPKNIDTTQQDIDNAKGEYQSAEIVPIFRTKNSVCAIKTPNGVNLCRSIKDKRPLLPVWYDKFEYDNKTGQKPCLKIDNEELLQTEAYPINPDGTLSQTPIIENKKHEKQITE